MRTITLPVALLWTLLPAIYLTQRLGHKAIRNESNKNDFFRFSAAILSCFVLQIVAEVWIHVAFDCPNDQVHSPNWPFKMNTTDIIFKLLLNLLDVIGFPAQLLAAGVSLVIALQL